MNVARWIAEAFGYDLVRKRKAPETLMQHLGALLSRLEIDLVLDVGANEGQYATRLRKKGYAGRIVSFEPAPEPFACLERASLADPSWQAVPAALGEASGVRTLNLTRGSQVSSFLAPNEYALTIDNELAGHWEVLGSLEVPVRTVDDVLAESDASKVFLKMDTQGFDLQVFRGARRSIDRIVALQSEIACVPTYEAMPDYVEALRVYRDSGFVPTAFFPIWRRDTLEVVEFDCVMRRGTGSGGAHDRG